MGRRLAPPILAALLLAAAPALPQDGGQPAPSPAAAPAEPAKPAEIEDRLLERLTGDVLRRIEAIRGLKMKAPVARRWTTREQARKDVIRELDEEFPPEKMAAFVRSLVFLGLAREGSDVKEALARGMAGSVGGYYDPDEKVFFLVKGFDDDGSRPIIFHELTHAVEDQYYDYFDRMRKALEADQSDRMRGVQAVVEGSAWLYMEKYMEWTLALSGARDEALT